MCFPLNSFRIEREWQAFGLKCVVVQNREAAHQHRCGYVRLPEGHPFHGTHYDDIDVDVHGGLTFAEHEPCIEEDGRGYWVGFDCAHFGDMTYDPAFDLASASHSSPQMLIVDRGGHYWTHDEVAAETERLAKQLAEYQ